MNDMTKAEIEQWMKDATYVDCTREYPDSCGNEEKTEIYQVGDDPQLYAVGYCNDHISEKWGERGYVRGVYLPYPVVKVIKTEVHVDYESGVGVLDENINLTFSVALEKAIENDMWMIREEWVSDEWIKPITGFTEYFADKDGRQIHPSIASYLATDWKVSKEPTERSYPKVSVKES
jgi:hypothetical protein